MCWGNSAAPAAHGGLLALSYRICTSQKCLQLRQDRQTDCGCEGDREVQGRGEGHAAARWGHGLLPPTSKVSNLIDSWSLVWNQAMEKQGWAQQILRSGFAFVPKAPGKGQPSIWALHHLQFSRCCSPPWSTCRCHAPDPFAHSARQVPPLGARDFLFILFTQSPYFRPNPDHRLRALLHCNQ